MRLPTLERDFWTLRSGEESHRAHPDTFWIPPIDHAEFRISEDAMSWDVMIQGSPPRLTSCRNRTSCRSAMPRRSSP
jgi:hypothetical protein